MRLGEIVDASAVMLPEASMSVGRSLSTTAKSFEMVAALGAWLSMLSYVEFMQDVSVSCLLLRNVW